MAKKSSRNTKARIVSAAWKLFYEQGYEETTVEEISFESETSKGSFYHYFDGKDALLSSLSVLFDERYEELMQQEFAGKLSICRSAPFFIETMPLGVGKDTSLEILLRAKGLTPANLMACGDGWNDLPMIRLAGMGVAMGNAQPPVKAAANYLTADNDHDGVGLAVEKFILNEET